jgi:hypothetical protein
MVRERRQEVRRALAEFLKPYDPAVRRLALGLRALVISEVAPCHETIFQVSYTVAFLYGTNPKPMESFAHISVHRRHVNLAFMRGSLLEDPQGMLKGDGRWMRHIQVKSADQLDHPELRLFLRAACAEADHTPDPGQKGTVLSIVKRAKPSKGRLPRRSSRRENLVRAKAGPR